MSPGFGQQPRFVVTIQPVGTMFNPPAAAALPNVDGCLPRQVTEMYSYDHDCVVLAIGTGTVSEDGLLIRSDPGVGVLKSRLALRAAIPIHGQPGSCPTCAKCEGTNCVPDNSQTPPQNAPDDSERGLRQRIHHLRQRRHRTADEKLGGLGYPMSCQQCQGGQARTRPDGSTRRQQHAVIKGRRSTSMARSPESFFRRSDSISVRIARRTPHGLHLVDGCSVRPVRIR